MKWYIYLFEHPILLLGLFGMFLIFLSIVGDENFDFWLFKHIMLTRWTKIVSFVTGLSFIAVMLYTLI
jgi:hypothetical protein